MKISVIMPCYNVEKYICESIESVLNQTYKNWELIIVDDGSSDGTLKVLEDTIGKDSRIILLKEQHKGPGNARNVGINKATGKYVTFLDSDDYWSVNHLEDIVDIVNKDEPDMVIYNQHTNFLKGYSKPTVLFDVPKREMSSNDKIHIIFSLDNKLPAANCLVVYKNSFLKEKNISYNCEYLWSEDLDLFLMAISNNPIIKFGNKEYYFYRQDNESATTKNLTGNKYINRLNVYHKWYKYYSQLGNDNSIVITQKILQGIKENVGTFYEIPFYDKDKVRAFISLIKIREIAIDANCSIIKAFCSLFVGQLRYYFVRVYRITISILFKIKHKLVG